MDKLWLVVAALASPACFDVSARPPPDECGFYGAKPYDAKYSDDVMRDVQQCVRSAYGFTHNDDSNGYTIGTCRDTVFEIYCRKTRGR